MRILDELIEKYCPDGVEYKTIGEIAVDIYRGSGITRDQVTESGTPCVRYGEIYTTYGIWFDECVSHTNEDSIANKKYFENGDILFAITGEKVEEIAKSCAYIGNESCLAGGDIVVLKHNQNPKYLSYALSTTAAQAQKSKGKVKSKVVHSSVPAIKEIVIPVPPIEVQREIVCILDSFTELTEKLKEDLANELTARRKQYEYYRDTLLPFADPQVEWKPLGEFCTIARGASPRPIKNFITDDLNGVNWIKIGDVAPGAKYITACEEKITVDGAMKSRLVKPGDFVLSNSMSFGRPYILQIEGCIHDGWLSISDYDRFVSSDYLYHILTSGYIQAVMRQKASFGGAVQNLNADTVRSIEIPVPPKEQQDKLVSILDKFSLFCTSITLGLPAEIEARQKQYEYYRDKLLTFKERAAE